ncbi:MAG: hypothetical protein ACREBZ_04150 [Thermoplasmata archaeon]
MRRGGRRPTPSERVRAALAEHAGAELARRMPAGYHRMGRVLLLRLPTELSPYRHFIGAAWVRELGVQTVIARTGPITGEAREPQVERIAGSSTETEVIEHGVRYRFDAAHTMFATGNRTERQRIATLVRPGEAVADLFAGIGYFTVPIAAHAHAARIEAVERNPVAYRYLVENLRPYRDRATVVPHLGDNRTAPLPIAAFDRVVLGYLPYSDPWIARAVELVHPDGAWLHVHRIDAVRPPLNVNAEIVAREVADAGGRVLGTPMVREVKPYGPGRRHVVVDVRVQPAPR